MSENNKAIQRLIDYQFDVVAVCLCIFYMKCYLFILVIKCFLCLDRSKATSTKVIQYFRQSHVEDNAHV